MTSQDVFPALVNYAIALEPSEVALVEAAGGSFIGYHATRKGYSARAASVGGTHFVAVAGDVTAHTSCASGIVGGKRHAGGGGREAAQAREYGVMCVPLAGE